MSRDVVVRYVAASLAIAFWPLVIENLGRLSDDQVEDIVRVIEEHSCGTSPADDLRVCHEIGKWERATERTPYREPR